MIVPLLTLALAALFVVAMPHIMFLLATFILLLASPAIVLIAVLMLLL